ncbi:hypothetical protein C5C74_16445 [Rathayibacter sp. AY1E8]|nr:hypothetical protein C5C74_16445 [Rathayibacter sp. AY1E8]
MVTHGTRQDGTAWILFGAHSGPLTGRAAMTARRRSRSDLFRMCVSLLVTIVVVLLVLATGTPAPGDEAVDTTATLVPVSLLGRPLSTALSVGWSAASYSRLDEQALRSAASSSRLDEQARRSTAEEEARGERRLLSRMLGATGATSTTLSAAVPAAVPAIVVTVAIAQRTEFRSEPLSLAAALLAVASSWVLMVFSFAKACLRLESRLPGGRRCASPSRRRRTSATMRQLRSCCPRWRPRSRPRSARERAGAWCARTSSSRPPSTRSSSR